MTKKGDRPDVAASVRQRLLNLAKTENKSFNDVLTAFGIERMLYRLGQSSYAERFVLKGALLFLVWQRRSYRVTRDVDLLGFGASDAESLTAVFQEICSTPSDPPDGIEFQSDSVVVQPIREEQKYGGMRALVPGVLANARIKVQLDIGFGDAITPGPETIDYPTLLDAPAPRLRAYPRYTVVAEKLEAMVHLGTTNSRMKDFYDVWLLSKLFEFEGQTLANAVGNTFKRRGTPIPGDAPLALTDEFATDSQKLLQWRAFLRKARPDPVEPDFGKMVEELLAFLLPVLESARAEEAFPPNWPATGPWQDQ